MADPEKKYTEKELAKLIEETTKYGAVFAHLFFDAHGKDKETVQSTLVEFVARMAGEKGVLYCKGEVMEPSTRQRAEGEEGYFTSAEMHVLAENFNRLHDLALRYSPVAVDIINPTKITLTIEEAHALLLDASTSSQEYSRYILHEVLKPEQFKKLQEQLERRAELGKTLMERGKEER